MHVFISLVVLVVSSWAAAGPIAVEEHMAESDAALDAVGELEVCLAPQLESHINHVQARGEEEGSEYSVIAHRPDSGNPL
ncbi:hypothetical protein BDK51DRAFT_46244 [Blyttiomyces helicus]|uniref:Uncharacterized protein n=1 Tax=Blyttiomyces helicus TaxID=388810 RepID=A0A4P9WDY0_9FUNG|nr:hypothetical protein BDK51DRAFT_46244 [Blyttiomyces helicus]|eukprot:RKO89170.1 hypothetical protein BDK51DRAFT_46244 [Blyttiomyces helicus]